MPHRCTVLVIEDDTDIRESIRLLLEMEDYPVLEAPDGAAGLRLLARDDAPLIVLLDYMMPGMDGLQMLREVAQDREMIRRHAYVLVTANYDRLPAGAAEMVASLGVGRVKKPFDIEALLAVVARECQRLTRGATGATVSAPAPPGMRADP